MLEGALLVAALVVGDPQTGEAVYSRCLGCHALEYNRTGPKHCGLIGRHAGAAAGYEYSPAMKKSKLVWNEKSLDRFLADPLKTVPGTTMTYAGVQDAKERADLVAYLMQQNASPRCTTKEK
jgi:cytochrome c